MHREIVEESECARGPDIAHCDTDGDCVAIQTEEVRVLPRLSHALVARAWAWLAAEADDLAEQKRYLEAIVALDPTLDWAQAALTRA